MSAKVELLVRNADENDVIPVILSSTSGFREDSQTGEFRKPLKWGPGETLALIGVVVAVAQLAVSIYEILRKSPGASVEIRHLESTKEPIVIEGKDVHRRRSPGGSMRSSAMIEVDYYRLFRPGRASGFAATGNSKWMGLVDPMTFVLRVNPSIDAMLRGEEQTLFAFNWSHEKQVAVGVFIHEMTHWWQLAGTTLGLLHAACVNVQSNILTSLLRDWVRHYEPRKSAFLAFRDAMIRRATPELNLLYNVVGRWMDLEFWSALMDQRSAPYRVANKPFFESSGKTLLRAAFYSLHQLLSLGGDAMHRAGWFNGWLDQAERLAQGPNEDFTGPGILAGLPIGGREILEGQARLIETQYLHQMSAGRLSFQQLESLGYFDKEYGHALREFTRLAGMPWPTDPLHPTVGLCLLVPHFTITLTYYG